MKLTQYVNAMHLLEGRSTRVLSDPWVTFGGISRTNLYNFPEHDLTPAEIATIKPDFIYITHTHYDHLCPETMALFDSNTPVLVADYPRNNFTERAVKRLGFRDVRVVPSKEGLRLNGDDHVWIEPAAIYSDVDSMALFKIDGQTFFNGNDCRFEEKQASRFRDIAQGALDVGLLPVAGSGPYPMFYENLSPKERRETSEAKIKEYFEDFVRWITGLRPRHVVPFAPGAMSGGPRALRYDNCGMGTAIDAVAYARRFVEVDPVYLSCRNSRDFVTGVTTGVYRGGGFPEHWDYVEKIAAKKTIFDENGDFYVAPWARVDLTRLLELSRATQVKWQDIRGIKSDWVYFIDIGEATLFRISLEDNTVSRVAEAAITDAKHEIFRMPYGLLLGLLTRHFNWSNVKTQYVRFFRRPNEFCVDLHVLMSHLHV
jgi:L-ascorbate metabolism protein UlaG (beta-lactamase superfamily)